MRLAQRPVIALHGSYRNGNFGDLLLLRVIADQVRSIVPDAEIILPLGSAYDVREVGADGHGLLAGRGSVRVLYGGGGYFGSPGADAVWAIRNTLRHAPPILLYDRIGGAPTMASGVGVGPLRSGVARRGLAPLLRWMRRVTVRDHESFEWACRVGVDPSKVSMGCDWALSIMPRHLRDECYGPLALHISRAIWSFPGARVLVQGIVRELQGRGIKVLCMSDNLADNGLLDRLGELGIAEEMVLGRERFQGVDKTLSLLAGVGRVLTLKLHVGLVATCLGAGVVALAAHPKIPRFYDEAGLAERCFAIGAHPRPETATDVVSAILRARPSQHQSMFSERLQANREDLEWFLLTA